MPEPIIIREDEFLSIRPVDSGLAHGYGLFETIAVKEGRLFFWKPHWDRLNASAKVFGLECVFSEAEVLRAIGQLLRHARPDSVMLKLSLLKQGNETRLYLYTRAPMLWPKRARLLWSAEYPLPKSAVLAGHKTHNYMENAYLLEEARRDGYDDCLRPACCGSIAETTCANLFWLKEDILYTPSTDLGILPGVTRAALLQQAVQCGITLREGAFTPAELKNAEAVFMTNSSVGLLPVASIDGEGFNQHYDSANPLRLSQLAQAFEQEQDLTALEIFTK